MIEKCYGAKRISYVVTFRQGDSGPIHVFVFHENQSMRKWLKKYSRDPKKQLEHYKAFKRSEIRAKYWYSKILEEHHSKFLNNQVEFTFIEN